MSVPGDADFRPTFKVEIATESLMGTDDTAVAVPFAAGAPSGVLGWSWWTQPAGGAQAAPVGIQVQPSGQLQGQLLFTQSGAQAQAFQFGIQRLFPITGGRRYAFSVDIKRWGIAPLQYMLWLETMASSGGGTTVGTAYMGPLVAPEDQQTFFVQMAVPTAGNATQIRITLAAVSLGTQWPQQLVYSNLTIYDVGAVEQAPEPVWHDVTCDVRAMSNRYGRERFSGRFEVGVMTYELRNESGEYSYQRNHPWGLTPGRLIRAQCEIDGSWYPMALGIIDDIKVEVEPDGTSIARIHAQDPTNLLSLKDTPNVSGFGLNYASHLRVMALERVIGFPSWLMDTTIGMWNMQQITQSGRSLRDEIGVTCDTEGSSFYASRAGKLTYRGRDFGTGTNQAHIDGPWRLATANLIANTWEETGAGSDPVGDMPAGIPDISGPYELNTEWSTERVINSVTLANRGGTARNYIDADSIREYSEHTYQRLDFVAGPQSADNPFISEATMLDTRANDFLAGNSSPTLRLTSVAFRPHQVCRTVEDWQWVLGVFLNHVVRICYINDKGNWGYITSTRVQAIDVDINPTEWRYKLTLDKPLSFVDFKAVQGGWDVEEWDVAIWDDDPTTDQAYWNSGQQWSDPLTKWGA